ncbi:MAG: 3-phosphoshikimate 1-carboxyvinyltransferase [Planctomycetia bacterium]|nr:3-phosphoshikimate 1-carboxyvinyltransferase [Planctomycetia bacterium]
MRGRVRLPGSKSITNRALVCAALGGPRSQLIGALDSDDTRVMIECLNRLGIRIDCFDEGQTLFVNTGGMPIPAESADLFVGNSGTTIRFLTALCTLGGGKYRLDGVERMRERPIGDLVDALKQLGARVAYEGREGFPPLVVHGGTKLVGKATVRGDISSQFLSALLMVCAASAADSECEIQINVEGELVSMPYVAMTLRVMQAFGVNIEHRGFNHFHFDGRDSFCECKYEIEPDASAASYFWAAAAITGGEVTVEKLGPDALQGDVRFVDCLQQMGCTVEYAPSGITVSGRAERGIDVDMNAISDTVQTLAAVALFAEGPTTIRGVAHIRHKETDRIGDLARELRKFGAMVDELPDGLKIMPSADIRQRRDVTIETYNDHRMAMSLALPGLVLPGITILNPGCTAKTYPRFFDDLKHLVDQS